MKNKEVIPIFFSIDDNYAPYLAVAMNSIKENASKEYQYKFIVLYNELSQENRDRLSQFSTDDIMVHFVPMLHGMESITNRMGNRLRCDYFTLTIYFRLFIPAMFPQYDKAIYLDSDIVVPGDISELYNVELNENLLAAAPDHSVVGVPALAEYMEEAIGVDRYYYINSGVLVMNLKELRNLRFEERFINLLTKYEFDCIAPDQDYINAMCRDRIVYLPAIWDAMPTEGHEPLADPKLIHYNLFSKPWCYDNVQYEEYFWKYAQDSGYLKEILEHKNNYSHEQKISDSKCMTLLVKRGQEIAKSRGTFKEIFEGGLEQRL